jgi:membrane-associated phospholipid phosphatase
MHYLWYRLPTTLKNILGPKFFPWYLIAILATWIIVATGFDGQYFSLVRDSVPAVFFSLAGMLGFFVPILLWTTLMVTGTILKQKNTVMAAWMSAQVGFLGFGLSSFIKIFTGRLPPPHTWVSTTDAIAASHGFQFGILRGGVFWGWPSSHTTTAFAMSIALLVFYRDKKLIGFVAVLYALYIAIGASMSFHWLSDVVFGIVFGTIIGLSVGRTFNSESLKND